MKTLKIITAILIFPLLSFAWNGVGHYTCGAIAYYYLKSNNPATITKVLNILKEHPWYNNPKWTDKLNGLSGEQRDVALFMLASTFPDDARDSAYGKPPMTTWHYVDYPYVPAGQTINAPQPKSPNAEEKIPELLKAIETEPNGAQRAIDVCWIFHLIEDIHQPLHTVSLFDANHPDGDRGGNLTFFISKDPKYPVDKLHAYWDGLIKGDFGTAPANAEKLLNDPEYRESKLTELKTDPTLHDWIYKESFQLAKEKAYLNGALTGTKEAPSKVPDNYDDECTKVAERRVVLAGIRVGKELTMALK